jgi:hypothetical protein
MTTDETDVFESIAESLHGAERQNAISLLRYLFPDSGDSRNEEELAKGKHISSIEYFDRYILMSVNEGDISDSTVESVLESISTSTDTIVELPKDENLMRKFVDKAFRLRTDQEFTDSTRFVLSIFDYYKNHDISASGYYFLTKWLDREVIKSLSEENSKIFELILENFGYNTLFEITYHLIHASQYQQQNSNTLLTPDYLYVNENVDPRYITKCSPYWAKWYEFKLTYDSFVTQFLKATGDRFLECYLETLPDKIEFWKDDECQYIWLITCMVTLVNVSSNEQRRTLKFRISTSVSKMSQKQREKFYICIITTFIYSDFSKILPYLLTADAAKSLIDNDIEDYFNAFEWIEVFPPHEDDRRFGNPSADDIKTNRTKQIMDSLRQIASNNNKPIACKSLKNAILEEGEDNDKE